MGYGIEGLVITGLRMGPHERCEHDVLHIECGELRFAILDDKQECCEDRYMTCDDDLESFVGERILSIEARPGSSTEEGSRPDDTVDRRWHDSEFWHINTTCGTIVLTAHNRHNGCYDGFDLVVLVE